MKVLCFTRPVHEPMSILEVKIYNWCVLVVWHDIVSFLHKFGLIDWCPLYFNWKSKLPINIKGWINFGILHICWKVVNTFSVISELLKMKYTATLWNISFVANLPWSKIHVNLHRINFKLRKSKKTSSKYKVKYKKQADAFSKKFFRSHF